MAFLHCNISKMILNQVQSLCHHPELWSPESLQTSARLSHLLISWVTLSGAVVFSSVKWGLTPFLRPCVRIN